MNCCVYVMRSLKDKNKYIGSTTDLGKRIKEHSLGRVESTKNRRPFILEAYQICDSITDAAELEKEYKRSHSSLERAMKNEDLRVVN